MSQLALPIPCQRWRDRRDSYRPAGEPIRTAEYEVAVLPGRKVAAAFVRQHHYSRRYLASRLQVGLYRRDELVGVAALSQPPSEAVLAAVELPCARLAKADLGRFVLLDSVPANGESWFLARVFEIARGEGFEAAVAYSDPEPRHSLDGRLVFPGHVGTIYQATNATYCGRTSRRTKHLFPDGTELCDPCPDQAPAAPAGLPAARRAARRCRRGAADWPLARVAPPRRPDGHAVVPARRHAPLRVGARQAPAPAPAAEPRLPEVFDGAKGTVSVVRVVEVFACSGGLAEGLRRAGLEVSLAFDRDADACDSYESNLGRRPIRMDVTDLVRLLRDGGALGQVDLFVADPPCTPWSRAGKRLGTADERDMLEATVELVEMIRPRAWLIGNIPGLDDSNHWPIVQKTIGGLAHAGYCVLDFARLDAADYGVPQHRVRPFWFGHAGGPCLTWPAPTHGDPSNLALPGYELRPWVTVRDALSHLPPEEIGRTVRLRKRGCNTSLHGSLPDRPARTVGTSNLSDGNVLLSDRRRSDGSSRDSVPDAPAKTIRAGRSSSALLLEHPHHPVSRLDEPSLTIGTKDRGAQGGSVILEPHPRHPMSRFDEPSFVIRTNGGRAAQAGSMVEWPWDRPSTTVTVRAGLPPPGHHPESGSIMTMPGAVVLSEKAAACLQGFPDAWRFAGRTKRARWEQIGQAVPPPLAEAIG